MNILKNPELYLINLFDELQLVGINRCPHIKYFSNKAQDFSESSEYLFLSSFFVTRWLFFLSWNKKSWSLPLFAKFLGGPFLFSHLKSFLWVTSWLTLQYLATLTRKNLCVPATSTQAERVFSWMGWLLKKEGSVCHENLSTCNYPWPIGGQSSALDLIHISHFWNYHL